MSKLARRKSKYCEILEDKIM